MQPPLHANGSLIEDVNSIYGCQKSAKNSSFLAFVKPIMCSDTDLLSNFSHRLLCSFCLRNKLAKGLNIFCPKPCAEYYIINSRLFIRIPEEMSLIGPAFLIF